MVSAEFETVAPAYRWAAILRGQARSLWLVLALLILSLGILRLLADGPQALYNSSLFSPSVVSRTIAQAHPNLSGGALATPSAPAPRPAPAVAASAVKVAAVQNCSPDSSYGVPSQLSLAADPNGLTQVIDPAAYYVVYGNSSDQLHAQLQQCAPGDEFAGETGYSLAWQYSTTDDGTGSCSINNVKVGLHVNMALPRWQPSTAATTGLTSEWQSFINGLTTHEDGHVAIDQQYGNQLLADLQSYPATDCGSIGASLQAKINTDIAALNAANDAYDARTNHGVTQGAVLP